ncbi:sucrose-6-phosphate hydrolase [Streptococcus sp. DD12]|uniref:sucrose-6-phosphate hydrolase n=1 Tax=Streptococcus sp. DD12 TaxID=1777880 RepID=UPI0007966CF4|nr:sucrose-6-phosphate hydrolase [Streptococcus sp. DD12]KXT75937.1 Sucrose-6-phosphate hydrolase [Streptococcus sp. DD12]
MNLPTEIRYRKYADWSEEEKKAIAERVAQSPWHTTFHLEPKTGLLNDPNGFSIFDGKFQLFYQNWPFGAAHGLKQWVHTTSTDLVHFTETGSKLLPDHAHDSHGAYSGSAYQIGDKLFLFYTGNVRDENWVRDPLQIGAWMDKDGQIEKCDHVLISQPEDVTEHFRDPQIFQYEDQYFAIVGAQSLDKKGFVKLYKALDNDVTNWEFVGDLDFGGTGSEYMIECPNLVFVDGHPVLLYSPQGLDKAELDYDNIYPNTYKICQSFDTKEAKLVGASQIHNLDYGFEAYATQGFNAPDGKVYIISWIGLPDVDYPTDRYDYQGAMSLVKELSLRDGKLIQSPVAAMKDLRQKQEVFADKAHTSNSYELDLTVAKDQVFDLRLFADEAGNGLLVRVDTTTGQVIVDRSKAGKQYALDFGTSRHCQITPQETKVRIFVDKSVVEIFVNDGEQVFTSRVFPETDQTGIRTEKGHASGYYYDLKG